MEKNYKKTSMACKTHRILMFFIPLLYAIETRFLKRSKLGVIVWLSEFLIPVTLAIIIIQKQNIQFLHTILAIISVYNLYEIGYIQNDCEVIKHEDNPTLRLSTPELKFYERQKYIIYLIRFIYGVGLTFYFHNQLIPNIILLILWSIIPLFYIYNKLRGRINLYLIFILTAYRYCMPLLLISNPYNINFWCISTCVLYSYPLLKLIEICAGGKSLPQEKWTTLFLKHYDDRFKFRIKYYLCLSLITMIISYINIYWHYAYIIPLYFLFLRSIQYRMPRLGPR